MSQLNSSDIKFLPGVGPQRAQLLWNELHIATLEDLIQYFPYKYVDRSKVYSINELSPDMPYIQFRARFVSMQTIGVGAKARLTATVSDGTGTVELLWFKGLQYVKNSIKPDTEYLVFGKPSIFNHTINIVHPEIDNISNGIGQYQTLQAFYNTTERMKSGHLNSKAIQKMMISLFATIVGGIEETLPAYILQQCHLMNRTDALRTIHFPKEMQQLERAKQRLKFEELFYIQLNILKNKNNRRAKIAGHVMPRVGELLKRFYSEKIPFEPTNAQKRVVREIQADINTGHQMNRLLQGDVGSGKTIVALMVMLIAIDNDFQTCLMAPTEILATQHFESISKMVDGLPVKVALLTGSTRKKQKETTLNELQNGEIQIIIGTHALIEDSVKFKNLGLVIIDEQHRFGVAQRAKLWAKSQCPPHILVMTATPIPRTLAMTVYGDLDVSVIDELPPGRKPIMTEHYFHNDRNSLNRFIKEEIAKGRQVYVVYPLIEESEKIDIKNLTEGFEYMSKAFPDCKVCMVHGRLKAAEKEAAMQQFVSGEAQIMVATTVIEVGVNVPNASIMIIESAERFGLSQLHQLRGRVGRGAEQSYCILMTDYKMSEETRKRMEVMVRTTNGFEIAEADMRLRGPGDMEGTQQSGLPFALKISDLSRDAQMVNYTREIVLQILEKDPLLEHEENAIFIRRMNDLAREKINWIMIS